jgi:hypothetical protein
MSKAVLASIIMGTFIAAEPVTGIRVTLKDSTGSNPDLVATEAPGSANALFTVEPGTWSATYQAFGTVADIGPAFTTDPLVVEAIATVSVQIPVGGALAAA